jgi:hypothetical protein
MTDLDAAQLLCHEHQLELTFRMLPDAHWQAWRGERLMAWAATPGELLGRLREALAAPLSEERAAHECDVRTLRYSGYER